MEERKRRSLERTLWIGVTAVLLSIILVLTFSTRALAGDQEAETQRLIGLFYEVLRFVQQNYVDEDKVDSHLLIEGALKGMFESLKDPYSAYLTGEDMRDLNDTTTGRFGGVGLIISKVEKGVEVIAPIEETPAFRAGVQAGDIITAIESNSIKDLSSDEVLKVLRGRPGTMVTITLLRGVSLQFDVKIERAMIEVPTVKHALIAGGIGYLRIIQFTPLTTDRVQEALLDLEEKGYRSLIVDLRGNPGGLLSATVDVADFFLDSGPIVSTRSRIPSENHVFYANRRNTIVDASMPVAVLINRGSASASEILAGALQDTKRATIIGEKSYGKGSVQQVKRINDSGFRLTMSRYFTPADRSIDKVGVIPDREVKEQELSPDEEKSFATLIEKNLIRGFVDAHPNAAEDQVASFIRSLENQGIKLRERFLRRMIRNEVNRTNNPPIYDLDYDLGLQEAVKFLSR